MTKELDLKSVFGKYDINVIVRLQLLWNNDVNYYLCSEIHRWLHCAVTADGFLNMP